MSNYQGKIYKIEHRFKKDLFYIGSTILTLKERIDLHKNNSKFKNYTLYKVIRNTGGWENFEISLIKEYPCNDKANLIQEEQRCIDALQPTLNTNRAYVSVEEVLVQKRINEKKRYEAKKEEINKKKKEYYELNKEELRKKQDTIMTCDCGREIKKGHIARHKKSAIHIELMNKNLTDI